MSLIAEIKKGIEGSIDLVRITKSFLELNSFVIPGSVKGKLKGRVQDEHIKTAKNKYPKDLKKLVENVLKYGADILGFVEDNRLTVKEFNYVFSLYEEYNYDLFILIQMLTGQPKDILGNWKYSEYLIARTPDPTKTRISESGGRNRQQTIEYVSKVWLGAMRSNSNSVSYLNEQLNRLKNNKLIEPKGVETSKHSEDEIWFFINGVVTDDWIARLNGECIADMFQRPVHLLHNRTIGCYRDLLECIVGRFEDKLPDDNIPPNTSSFYSNIVAQRLGNELIRVVKHQDKDKNKKIVVIAHSQGTIVLSNIIQWYMKYIDDSQFKSVEHLNLKNYLKKLIGRMEIYNFAFCHDRFPSPKLGVKVKHMETFNNKNDLVARLSWNPLPGTGTTKKTINANRFDIPYDFHIAEERWGHPLNVFYLKDFKDAYVNFRTGNTDAQLYSYLDGGPA